MREIGDFPGVETDQERDEKRIQEYLHLGYQLMEINVPEDHEFADTTVRRVYKTVLVQGAKRKIFYLENPVEFG